MPDTVTWEISQKDGKKFTVPGKESGFSLNQANLTISTPISVALEGAKLTCTGKNAFGSASAATSINLVYGMSYSSHMLPCRQDLFSNYF